jgi:long-chain acyl-CoA synthetase
VPPPAKTLVGMFLDRATRTPDLVAMRHKSGEAWNAITYREFAEAARDVANGFVLLGIEKGQSVGLLSKSRPEWLITDYAVMMTGGWTVPIYATNSPPQVAYVIRHCSAPVAVVEDQDQLDKILKEWGDLPSLQKIVVMTGEGTAGDDRIISFEELRRLGKEYAASNPKVLDESITALQPDDVATIIYTSGTTGDPKGALLTHANGVQTLQATHLLGLKDGMERWITYLPLSHIFERLITAWAGPYYGGDVWFAESIDKLRENIEECRPTFFTGVPRVYEKFYIGVTRLLAKEHGVKRKLIDAALEAGHEKVRLEQAGAPVPAGLRTRLGVLDKLVLSKIRHGLGMDKVNLAISGSAPLAPEIIKFIHAIGIRLAEGYGLTETTAPVSVNPPEKIRIGTVGPALPCCEVRLDADGEILVKGANVFAGYHRNEEATRESFTSDGFFRTGDIGEFDRAGYIRITDRKKDLIITAGGKNIAPQEIEGRLKLDPLVSQAVVIGDRRPFISALVTLDPDEAPKWAEARGIRGTPAELATNPKVLAEIELIVNRVNEDLSQVERVKKWTVLPNDFTQEADEITPSLKVRRKIINEKYSGAIEEMYAKGDST